MDELDDYDMGRLRDMKEWLYRTRVRAREDTDRADRREQKDQARQEKQLETEQKESLQPKMFDL